MQDDDHRFAPIAGPIDRSHFLDEQQRHRRASRWYAVLCAVLVIAMCTVMSVLLAPILYSVIGLALDVVNIAIPMPNMLGRVWASVEHAIDGLDQPGLINRLVPLAAWGAIPGLVLLGVLWLGLRRLLRRAGVDGLLAAMPVRPANPLDLEEKQLVNVVEEIAIAASVKPPRVMLTDATGINCGAVGTKIDDAVLIVSRGLLERLDRDETQGVIAHLIASIGHGDMRIGLWMISVMQMLSALSLVVYAPVNREARALLWRLLRLGVRPASTSPAAESAERQLLAGILANPFNAKHSAGAADDSNKWAVLLTFPAMIVDLIFSKVFNLFVLTPALGFAWRRRKYLADAAAVQLTRHPDGLAHALVRSRGEPRAIPGGQWPAHLFVFDTRASTVLQESMQAEQAQGDEPPEAMSFSLILARLSSVFGKPAPAGSSAALAQAQHRERFERVMRAARRDASSEATGLGGGGFSFFPSSKRRVDRLHAMGATVRVADVAVADQWKLWVVLAPLFALLVLLVGALFVLGTYVVAMLSMVVIALPVGALHALLRWIGG